MTLRECTLSGNSALDTAGAIFNEDTMALVDCVLSGNSAVNGARICNIGRAVTLTLTRCTLTGNSVTGHDSPWGSIVEGGGAIWNAAFASGDPATASLTIEDSTLSANTAQIGGAILNASDWDTDMDSNPPGTATANIARTTFSGNSAKSPEGALGGAIACFIGSEGSLALRNCTLANNSATFTAGGAPACAIGGAIFAWNGTLTVDHSTLSGNVDAGGDFALLGRASGISAVCCTTIKNTILANDPSAPNLAGAITSAGYNLSSDDGGGFLSDPTDKVSTDPKLSPLADNGGPTWTCALLAGSPAIDAGSATDTAGNTVATDQRGVARPQGFAPDIGAFELAAAQNHAPVANAGADQNVTIPHDGAPVGKPSSRSTVRVHPIRTATRSRSPGNTATSSCTPAPRRNTR